ncbi:tryptophan synthase subunit alpha, partial [Nitratireductor aquimarinus]|nr:tryptophan synthase subunit alpha [Nitratireductor aquimarinus]
GVVVGSAIVATIAQCYDADGNRIEDPAEAVATLVKGLADGVREARLAVAR